MQLVQRFWRVIQPPCAVIVGLAISPLFGVVLALLALHSAGHEILSRGFWEAALQLLERMLRI